MGSEASGSLSAVGPMKESKALDWLEEVELFLYRKANAVVSVTSAFRDNLIRRGIDGDKIQVVTNGVNISRFRFAAISCCVLETSIIHFIPAGDSVLVCVLRYPLGWSSLRDR